MRSMPDADYAAADRSAVDMEVEPARGRLLIFTAGHENLHRVARVHSGERMVLSFWFTCDGRRVFDTFLQGRAHFAFKDEPSVDPVDAFLEEKRREQEQGGDNDVGDAIFDAFMDEARRKKNAERMRKRRQAKKDAQAAEGGAIAAVGGSALAPGGAYANGGGVGRAPRARSAL